MSVKNLLLCMCLATTGTMFCAKQKAPIKETDQLQNNQTEQVSPLIINEKESPVIIDEDKACMQRVIITFARIAQSFFNIASSKDPKDPIVLGQNLTEMAAGVIKIAMEMFRSSYCIDDESPRQISFEVNDEDIALIQQVVARMKEQLIELDQVSSNA